MNEEVPTEPAQPAPKAERSRRLRARQIILIVVLTMIATAGVTAWAVSQYLFRKSFTPVQLKPKEEKVLNAKLQTIGYEVEESAPQRQPPEQPLKPERYSEEGARREVSFSEREVNAMLAKNTDLAQRLAIDLSDDLVSAKLLVPIDPDFPVLGGKTLRVSAGVELAFRNGRPVVVLKGISVMGVPIPNAWLGNLKNIDLVREFGGDPGFWKSFSDGIDYIQVEDGRLLVKLKE